MPTIEDDYLEHCVPWTGIEKDRAAGVIGLPAGVDILDLIKTVTVLDPTVESGFMEIVPDQLTKSMKPIAATLFEDAIEAMGSASIRIIDPDGGAQLTRRQWYDALSADGVSPRHTDGLAMWAVNRLQMKINGGGVHF